MKASVLRMSTEGVHLQKLLERITVVVVHVLNQRVERVSQSTLADQFESRAAHPVKEVDFPAFTVRRIELSRHAISEL